MSDYISRDAFILEQCHKCDGWCCCKCDCLNCKSDERCYAIKDIADFPAADVVERKRGEWWKSEDELGEAWMCSECLEEFFSEDPDFKENVKFCPNCGARMVNE